MFDKDVPGFVRYTAWRRTLPCGKTEYKSVTIAPDVTPQEFMDMYLDDAFRRNWVRAARAVHVGQVACVAGALGACCGCSRAACVGSAAMRTPAWLFWGAGSLAAGAVP